MLSELTNITCPHCNASIEIVYVPADGDQDYVEDCEVCCKPMLVSIQGDSISIERDA